jgi:hypothetical protein
MSNFTRPLREHNYIIMCLACFFMYCTFVPHLLSWV